MPNKKAVRNAYYFFVLEKVPELQAKGFNVKNIKDAIPLCSGDWATLKSTMPVVKNVPDAVEPQVTAMPWPNNQAVLGNIVYIIEVFSLGEMPPACGQRFLPCEIACVKYCLQDGILGEFHCFPDPGEIPCGFRYHCQAGSEASHKIPVSGFELADDNYHKIFKNLCEFVGISSGSFVPVYCKKEDWYRVNWCLNWLARKAGRICRLLVCELEDLVVKVYKYRLKEEPSVTLVRSMLEVFQWDYTRNTRCKWHEENDIVDCALAVCKKYTYCVSEALAPIYGFPLTPAHIPEWGEKCGTIINPKVVVMDAGRFMKSKSLNTVEDKGSAGLNAEASAAGGEQSLFPSGVIPGVLSAVRGRGITRRIPF
ncbi:protein maelstrom homolog isoform X2 [Protopterus annectens]|uniref:protein maelstrom homolog isoform X2 n=1 Tax=Protopterus annectens TaxID=7888 RepID=UPI001CFB75C8|nr:protein maelstrom homolog isoform X2 [Protopterus annectens]